MKNFELEEMLMGHTDGLSTPRSSRTKLLPYAESDIDEDDSAGCSEKILYLASFEELAMNIVNLGVGIIMLLYLPFKRYVLQKDISSRKLYVTPTEVVYKVSRPSFIPFWGITTIEKHVPLSLVIDIIIEQGCLQSRYGIHTFRIESIAHGKAAAVDELQVQGVSNPSGLRKKLQKAIQDSGISWRPTAPTAEGESMARTGSLSEGPAVLRSPSKSLKMAASPHYASIERRGVVPGNCCLIRLKKSIKSVKLAQGPQNLIDSPAGDKRQHALDGILRF
ncbi:hypothetical protein Prudu_006656 [Prunus dulcis]|uniref:DUF7642 domain-containing protein n=1 Tax=Prunus dulcis TaxID=3755 RepID=A0A4Y1R086_PRUDU|nr:hypothetical protein Prudu_006656 [Prunus dulcis]